MYTAFFLWACRCHFYVLPTLSWIATLPGSTCLLSTCSWQAFEVDKDAPEYRALHPYKQKSKTSLLTEHFNLMSEDHNERGAENEDDFDASRSFQMKESEYLQKKTYSRWAWRLERSQGLFSHQFYMFHEQYLPNQKKQVPKFRRVGIFMFPCSLINSRK